MEKATLPARLRDKSVKAHALRRLNRLPAEFYGRGVENVSLELDQRAFRKLYRTAGSNTVLDLEIEGNGMQKVLVHRVDFDPVTDEVQYAELINVRMDEEVTAMVPILLEGQAPAVKDMQGVLVQSLDEIEISCLPGDLIHEVTLNVESLVDFNTSLHVSDLVVPEKIKVLTALDVVVATVTPPMKEEEVAPAEAPTVEGVEVTTEKKEGEAEEGVEGKGGAAPGEEKSEKKEK